MNAQSQHILLKAIDVCFCTKQIRFIGDINNSSIAVRFLSELVPTPLKHMWNNYSSPHEINRSLDGTIKNICEIDTGSTELNGICRILVKSAYVLPQSIRTPGRHLCKYE